MEKEYVVQLGSLFKDGVNKNGIRYDELNAVLKDENSIIVKCLKNDSLLGEIDPSNIRVCHDLMTIDYKNAAFKITDVTAVRLYDDPAVLNQPSKDVIIGKIRPLDNDNGKLLSNALDNPNEEVTFGLRAITINTPDGVKLDHIITWDLVLNKA